MQAVDDVSLALAKEVVTQTHMASKALEAATHAGVPNTQAVSNKQQAVLTALTKVFPQLIVPEAPHMDQSIAAMLQSGAVVGKMALDEAQSHTKSVFSLIERLEHTYVDHQHPLPTYFGKLKLKAQRARNALDNLIKDDTNQESKATADTNVVAAKSASMSALLAADHPKVVREHLPAVPDSLGHAKWYEVAKQVAIGKKPTEVMAQASGVLLPEPLMPPEDHSESMSTQQPPQQRHERAQQLKPREQEKGHPKHEKQSPRGRVAEEVAVDKKPMSTPSVELRQRLDSKDSKDLPKYAAGLSEQAERLAADENKKLEMLAAWERRSVEARAAAKAQAAQIRAADAALQSAKAASNETLLETESAAAKLAAAVDAANSAKLLAKHLEGVSKRAEGEMMEASMWDTRAKHTVDFARVELQEADVSRAASTPKRPARFSCPPHHLTLRLFSGRQSCVSRRSDLRMLDSGCMTPPKMPRGWRHSVASCTRIALTPSTA